VEVSNQLSLFTTTYERDFDLLERLLISIEKYLQTEYQHYIILNDDIAAMSELTSILDKFSNNFIVIHHDEFKEMHVPKVENCKFGTRTHHEGWFRQIILTLLVATKITTPYYLHLCSKDSFSNKFNIDNLIQGDKFLAQREQFTQQCPVDINFNEYFINAYKLFDLDPEDYRKKTIRPSTPAILKTQQVNDLLVYLTNNNLHIIDVIGGNAEWCKSYNKTVEYYLYSAWLAKNNILDSTISWSDFSRCQFGANQTSYDLRRTN
jgi:hypothetical protein